MRRHDSYFYSEPISIEDGRLTLSGEHARHLAVVRRGRRGDRFFVSDGHGRVVEAALTAPGSDEIQGEVVREWTVAKQSPALRVIQGAAKGSRLDLAIEKLVEVGVDDITVFRAGRSVPRWDAARESATLARWRRIALSAAQQSRRAWLPAVSGPLELNAAVALVRPPVLLADRAARRRLRDALGGEPPPVIDIVIGPEGGLTTAEMDSFEAAGAEPVSLGDRVLRTETAGPAIVVAILYHFGRFG